MLPTVVLQRLATADDGTLGRLTAPNFACLTLELPWRENANGLSCIPAGRYLARWTRSPRLRKYTYEITDVPGRAGIRLHAGNLAGDVRMGLVSHSLGCPLLGLDVGRLKGQLMVTRSKAAVTAFEFTMAGQSFTLEVRDGMD